MHNLPSYNIGIYITVKNAVFWDVMLCGSHRNQRYEGTSVASYC
jgi:hypothetical protein